MKLLFLGNGGGRGVLATYFTSTGGFLFIDDNKDGNRNDTSIVVFEPGIQSYANFRKTGYHPKNISAIVVTHNHLDHIHDLLLYLEGVSYLGKKKPLLLASKNVLIGDERYDKFLSSYHSKKAVPIVGNAGDVHRLESLTLLLTKTKHDEPSAFGFVADTGKWKFGYTSDTEYFPGLGEQFKGCDLLIVNNLKPEEDGIPDHLSTKDTINILMEAQPKICILYHLGLTMFRKGLERELRKISDSTGIECFTAEPFLEVEESSNGFSLSKVAETDCSWGI